MKGQSYADGERGNKAFDGLVDTFYTSSDPICFVGYDFGESMIADIKKIRVMPNPNWRVVGDYIHGAVF